MGSSDGYRRSWKKWLDFLQTVAVERPRPQEYLENVAGGEAKVKWLILFVSYLKKTRGVPDAKSISGVLAGLKFMWKCRCLDCDFFASKALAQARQGARMTTDEMREAAWEAEQTKILPAIVEMLIEARKQLWEESGMEREGIDQKGTYIGLAVSFDSGLRPCSVTLRDGPRAEDHCIRAKHFLFWVELATGRIRLTGGGRRSERS